MSRNIVHMPFAYRIVWQIVFIASLASGSDLPNEAIKDPLEGGYAVVVSKTTQADPAWNKVVDALVAKHSATVIAYDSDVASSLAALREHMPRYACFVARPEEAGRGFVVKIHRLTRRLNDDPYTDLLWGIITGYDPKDALRIASVQQPLLIHKGAAGTGLNLDAFDEGIWFNEGVSGEYWRKSAGGHAEKFSGPADNITAIADMLNVYQPEFFLTSGHASEHDWQPGYAFKDGDLRSHDGKLIGRDLKGALHPIDSPSPKVYLGAGNCLIGHIKDKQSMALAWLGSGGANQVVGYTVVTWFGAMGWGTRDYFFDLSGRYTLAESFYFSNQLITNQLQTRFPDKAGVEFDAWDVETHPELLDQYAKKLSGDKPEKNMHDLLGLLWDHDTVAFYGDPAWVARLASHAPPLSTTLIEKDGVWHFVIHANETCTPSKPLAMFFSKRLKNIEILSGKEFEPLITTGFIMLLKPGSFKAGQEYEVVFKAKEL